MSSEESPSRHRRTSSLLSGRTALLEGIIAKESNLESQSVYKRQFRFFSGTPPVLASYKSDEKEPCDTWVLTSACILSDIAPRQFRFKTSRLARLRKSSRETTELHSFTLTMSTSLTRGDTLTLGFDDPTTAATWRNALQQQIDALNKAPKASLGKGLHHSPSFIEDHSDSFNKASSTTTSSSSSSNVHPRRTWRPFRNINGVAVYVEEVAGENQYGALMASAVVRAPPAECFKSLMHSRRTQGSGVFFGDVTVLEYIDSRTQIIQQRWQPGRSLTRHLCAPREVVAVRTWKEDEGVYVVVCQSTKHAGAREAPKGSFPSWSTPIRANVMAAGYTLSPLLPQYTGGGPSRECLVTLVVQMDLGGGLAANSLLTKTLPAVADAARWALLEPMILSVVLLRNRVEQSRFVLQPFTREAGEVDEEGVAAVADHEVAPAVHGSPPTPQHKVLIHRTTTSVIKEPLDLHISPLPPPKVPDLVVMRSGSSGSTSARLRPVDLFSINEDAECFFDAECFLDARSDLIDEMDVDLVDLTNVSKVAKMSCPLFGSNGSAVPVAAAAIKPGIVVPKEEAWAVQGTCKPKYWIDHGSANLKVRGKQYLQDRVKVAARDAIMKLHAVDLLNSDEPIWGAAKYLPSVKYCTEPFAFVLQLIFPNQSLQGLIMTWTLPVDPVTATLEQLLAHFPDDNQGTVSAFFKQLKSWMEDEGPEANKRRNTKFKLIPRIAQGPWIVKKSVGTTPVLLGQKLNTKYFKGVSPSGTRFFEVVTDITSNNVASSITRMVVNSITSLSVELAPLVEGQSEEELPERLIGTVRFDFLDLRTAAYLDEDMGLVTQSLPGGWKRANEQ